MLGKEEKIYSFDAVLMRERLYLPVGEVFQASELSIMRGSEIYEHVQECDEITYIISGGAKFYCDDVCQEVRGGQIHFVKKGVRHKIVAENDENFRYICFGINPDFTNENLKNVAEYFDIDSFLVQDDGNVRIFSELLINEFYLKDNSSDIMINLYISQIFIALARIIDNNGGKVSRDSYKYSRKQFTMYHLLRYIDREYINIKSIRSIAEKLSYSEYYLTHLFKERMGISIKEYLIRKKMMMACELLKTTDMTITGIAEYLNMGTAHTFSQSFKKVVSISPTEYKNMINSKF